VAAGSTPSATFCDAVFTFRRLRQRPDLTTLIPLHRPAVESRLKKSAAAFAEMARTANDGALRTDLERLDELQRSVDRALLENWGDDGVELLAAADVWGGNIVDYSVRDGIAVDGQIVDRGEYQALRSDLFERVSFVCDERPSDWVPVIDLPQAAVPSDLRYAMVMRVADELQLMLGSHDVSVFPFPAPSADLQFTNPVVSPDGQSIVVMGFDGDVLHRAYVGRFDSLFDMEQVAPDDEAWNCLSWSTDSSSLVVTRLVSPGRWKQSEYEVASGNLVDLFETEYPSHEMPCGAYYDEDTLLVTGTNPETGIATIWSQDVGSTERELFVSIPDCNVVYPQVRPGTTEVAVISACANAYDSGLWIVPEPGAEPRHILNGLVAAPAWSDDGEWILFGYQTDRTSVPELWIASADGSSAAKLVNGWSSWPAWIPTETPCTACAD
jgi:hypothetical protein